MEQLQSQSMKMLVFLHDNKKYVTGWVLNAAGFSHDAFQGADKYYEVTDDKIRKIVSSVSGAGEVHVEIEWENIPENEISKIAFNDDVFLDERLVDRNLFADVDNDSSKKLDVSNMTASQLSQKITELSYDELEIIKNQISKLQEEKSFTTKR